MLKHPRQLAATKISSQKWFRRRVASQQQLEEQENNQPDRPAISTSDTDTDQNALRRKFGRYQTYLPRSRATVGCLNAFYLRSPNADLSRVEKLGFELLSHRLPELQKGKLQDYDYHISTALSLAHSMGNIDEAKEATHKFLLLSQTANIMTKTILSPTVPNTLLEIYANSGDYQQAISLYNMMIHKSINPELSTFAWLLLSAVNQADVSLHKASVQHVLDRIDRLGRLHELEDSLTSSLAKMDQANKVKVIEALDMYAGDKLSLKSAGVDIHCAGYTNSLVDSLNESKLCPNPFADLLSDEEIEDKLHRQLAMESERIIAIDSVDEFSVDRESKSLLKQYKEMKKTWADDLTTALNALIESKTNPSVEATDPLITPFYQAMPVDAIVHILLREAEKMSEMSELYSPSTGSLAGYIGMSLPAAYVRSLNNHDSYLNSEYDRYKSAYSRYIKQLNSPKLPSNHRLLYMSEDTSGAYEKLTQRTTWSSAMQHTIGSELLDVMVKTLKLPLCLTPNTQSGLPAFYIVYRMVNNKTQLQLKPHPTIIQFVKKAFSKRMLINVEELPTLVPPVPWCNKERSVYATIQIPLLRVMQARYLSNVPNDSLYPIFDALNVAGACPWIINKTLLDLVVQQYREGGDNRLGVPEVSDKVVERLKSEPEQGDAQMLMIKRKMEMDAFSTRCGFSLGLSVANHFRDEVFWLPLNLDFRGRAYPLSAHFSQVSSDPMRAMLKFAKGKKLGKRGLEWLKIHLINLAGLKKTESNAARLEHAEEVLPLAIQSATTPMDGMQWWQESDSPWQTLSVCQELKAAYEFGDPTEYVSHLPVHQDGSCNGLQHYAAMGRDSMGAASVNVSPSPQPQDVYTDVARLVEKLRAEDAAAGNKIAKALEGEITRKVVKQSVMTTVYGVTEFGTYRQILKHLSDQMPNHPLKFRRAGAEYISTKLSTAMGTIFHSSTQIQNWLTLLAYSLCTKTSQPISWVTPLGLPVVQQYYKNEKINAVKQKNGMPPNFIHSLDSTHMMLTALLCARQGVAFVSIHDCFWTHACDVDIMNKICRQAFVDLYEQPILENLSRYLKKKYLDPPLPNAEHQQELEAILSYIPKFGDFDIRSVHDSEYFFS